MCICVCLCITGMYTHICRDIFIKIFTEEMQNSKKEFSKQVCQGHFKV